MNLVILSLWKTALIISENYLPENVSLETMEGDRKALKSSEEITKLEESTSVNKSFAKMGVPELT